MKKRIRQLTALLLAMTMSLSLLSANVWAVDDSPAHNKAIQVTELGAQKENTGLCGKNVTWSFDASTGILTISGTGAIVSHSYLEDYFKKIKTVVIKQGVTGIGKEAFSGCKELISVSIPDSVNSIGEGAFSGCRKLEDISIPDGITKISNNLFDSCSSLSNIIIPSTVTEIGAYAFASCENLKDPNLPDRIKTIRTHAFAWCYNIKKVCIPSSVTSIGESAFFGCKRLKTVSLPDNLKNIEKQTFFYCNALTTITIPASVSIIGMNAFYNCDKLTISGYSGSVAEIYAKANGIMFKALADPLTKTTLSSVKAGKAQMTVQWKKNTTGKGYEVQYSTNKKFKKGTKTVKIKKNTTDKTTIKKLKKKTYYVRIRTANGKAYSAWSKTKTVKVK